MKKKLHPQALEAKQAASEEFETRLLNNDPPEIGQVVRRLEASGYSRAKAEEKALGALLRTLIEGDSKKDFDLRRARHRVPGTGGRAFWWR
jgi:hypothetical protein